MKTVLALFFMLSSVWGWGQTTATYDFSATGAVTGLDATPPISIDANIGFSSHKNSGTSNPALNDGQLRLYQNATKGGSIKIYANNGAIITSVVVNASGSAGDGPAGYSVDNTTEAGSFPDGTTVYTITGLNATNYVEFYNKGNSSTTRTYVDSFTVTYTLPSSTNAPVVTASSQTATVGTPFTYQIQATESPSSYDIVSGTLPAGLTLDSASGVISGTPTAAGTFSVGVTATNSIGTSAQATIDFTVNKGTQTITGFEDTVINYTNTQQVTLPTATDQGLSVSYVSSNPAIAAISGNTLTFSSEGTVTVTATQAGNNDYETLTVAKTFQASNICFSEDFAGLAGNNTASTGSNSSWGGNTNFPTVTRAFQAGNAVRIGASGDQGSITSLPLANIGGNVAVTFDVKGWTNVEGDIIVTLGGVSQTVTYTAVMGGSFETKSVNFTNVPLNSTLTIATSAKRAFIDNVTVSCGTATVWNGTAWSNGTPDATKMAVIAEDYTGSGFEAASVMVEAGKTANFTEGFVQTTDVTNNGTINLDNAVNFVQTGNYTVGTGSSFNMKRDSKPVKRLNYIAWSSPMKVSSQTLKEFSYGNVNGANQSATGTVDNRFYKYNNGIYVTTPATGTFTPLAQGFFIRTPNDFTTTQQVFHGMFTGTEPNSGNITYDASGITGEYVFLGNPYPGAISIAEFQAANPNTNGTIYIWNSQSDMNTTSGQYDGTNYHTYTATGAVPSGSIDGYIAAGQAFFVSRTNAQSAFDFTNAMRVTANSGIFNKAAGAVTDKFWLQLDHASGVSSQMLMAFAENASENMDYGFDAKLINVANSNTIGVLYTKVNNDNLIIDTHGAFHTEDQFNVYLNTAAATEYTLSLAQKEGVFAGSQAVYLKDKLNGNITDLSAGSYTFTSAGNGEENRFEVIFASSPLATDTAVKQDVVVVGKNGEVNVRSNKEISSVEVYDMSGKLLATKTANSKTLTLAVGTVNIALVVVKLNDSTQITKKVKL